MLYILRNNFFCKTMASMEKRMEDCAQEIMTRDQSLRGVMCTDTNGALYYGKGTMENAAHSAAVASQLANLAVALEPNSQPTAVVLSCSSLLASISPPSSLLHHQQGTTAVNNSTPNDPRVLIKRNSSITIALHK